MSPHSTKTIEFSPAPEKILEVLAGALARRPEPGKRRVIVSNDSRSPDEGLAILQAYIAIKDETVRQAILDLLTAIAGTDPYR